MKTLRLFIAIELNNIIWGQLEYVIQYLKTQDLPSVRWVPVRNTHLTLKFLGEVPEERLPSLNAMITKVATQFNPFYMVSSGLGALPLTKPFFHQRSTRFRDDDTTSRARSKPPFFKSVTRPLNPIRRVLVDLFLQSKTDGPKCRIAIGPVVSINWC